MIPEYQDILARGNIRNGQLPLYISVHTFVKVALHHHDFAELSFVVEGFGTETLNGETHPLRPGSVSFLLPHHIHELRSDGDTPMKVICCMFDISILFGSPHEDKLAGLLLGAGSDLPSFVDLRDDESEKMKAVLYELMREYRNDSLCKECLIRSKLIEALLLFVRACGSAKPAESISGRLDTRKKMSRLIRHVHLNFKENLTLKQLSDQFHLSVPYISRAFRKQTGRSLLDYIHELRINSAASLLVTTDLSIAEISSEVGFESFRTFSRVFKLLKGKTPSEYRRSARCAIENETMPSRTANTATSGAGGCTTRASLRPGAMGKASFRFPHGAVGRVGKR